MMEYLRKYLILTSVCILSLVFWGCSGNQEENTAGENGIEKEKLTADSSSASESKTTAESMNILLEAETAINIHAPVRLVDLAKNTTDTGTSLASAANGTYLDIPQGAGKPPEVHGDAELSFIVDKQAMYYLWARVWWMDGCGNSVGMSLDNGKEFIFGQDATYKKWHWVKIKARLKQLNLAPGEHSLKLSNREDGVAIDQILFTRNKRYVPVGVEKAL